MEQNYAFIDSQNLNLGTRSAGWQLDFKKFRLYLKNKYGVQKAYFFIGYIEKNESLYKNLAKYGYTIVYKPTLGYKRHGRVVVKGNVDAELVLHAMYTLNKFDKAVIVSGDGDFYCLVEFLLERNKLKRLLVPNNKFSTLLSKFNFHISILTDERRKLEYGHKTKVTETRGRSKP